MGVVLPPPVTEAEQRPVYQMDLATVHVAIYDAVNGIDRRFQAFAVMPSAPVQGASQEAAVVGATYNVLKGLFPGRSSLYQAQYDAYLVGAAGNLSKQRGLAVGAEVAAGVLAKRANDGRMTPAGFTTTGEPGDFDPVPGAPLVAPFVPFTKPFALPSASRLRPHGPPALDSVRYADGLNEVQAMGSAASVLRTAEQSDLARFHTDPPPLFWARNIRRLVTDDQSIATNARLLAYMWVAQSDALLTCFEAKYHYRYWRPRTSIPRAAEDRNDATIADTGWAPFLPTPNHPEYPAAHGCGAGAFAEVLREFYGTRKVEFTIDSGVAGLLDPVREYSSTRGFVDDVIDARVYGGMHYRFSVDKGADVGRRVAHYIGQRYFQPANCGRRGRH